MDPFEVADAHFRDAALAATMMGRLGRSLWPYRRMCLAFWNLRLCASLQHGAALKRRRASIPYLGVRRRQCRK